MSFVCLAFIRRSHALMVGGWTPYCPGAVSGAVSPTDSALPHVNGLSSNTSTPAAIANVKRAKAMLPLLNPKQTRGLAIHRP